MYALPVLVVNAGQPKFMDGSLVHLPIELQSRYQLDWYAHNTKNGWNKCPQGYSVYVESDPVGNKYVLPGLIIAGEVRPKKKYYPNPIEYKREEITAFAKSIMTKAIACERQRIEN